MAGTVETQSQRQEFNPPPMDATLDDEEDIDSADEPGSVMMSYLHMVHDRLQQEVSNNSGTTNWLLPLLKKDENEWWVRANRAKEICSKLGNTFSESSYYRDIFVWLPDIRWNTMPPCVECRSNTRVGAHGFRANHDGRRICSLDTHYFIISRRYICHKCEDDAKESRVRATEIAQSCGLVVSENEECMDCDDNELTLQPPQYTFMGWDARSLPLLSYGHGEEFPAFITWRGGVDKQIIDLMRPLMNKGVRPETISAILLELHTKKYTKCYLKREQELDRTRLLHPETQAEMFSTFSDKSKYAGQVPTGNYIAFVYKKFGASITAFLAKEVKKRNSLWLSWDASYKTCKKLARYHSLGIFKALITAVNEFGEIRIQFHVVTDGHDQMISSINAFMDTVRKLGQLPLQLLFTDKPAEDGNFFRLHIPSLQESHTAFNSSVLAHSSEVVSVTPSNMTTSSKVQRQSEDPITNLDYNIHGDCIKVLGKLQDIETMISALRQELNALPEEKRVVALDAEWDTVKNARGLVCGNSKVALIQLGYRLDDNVTKVLIIQTCNFQPNKLSNNLKAFFEDDSFTFIGRLVGGDLAKIGKDFRNEITLAKVKRIDIGTMARERNVVNNGAAVSLSRFAIFTVQVSLPL